MCLVFAIPPGSDPLKAKMTVCNAVRSANTFPRFVPLTHLCPRPHSHAFCLQGEGAHRISREWSRSNYNLILFVGIFLRCANVRFLAFSFRSAISLAAISSILVVEHAYFVMGVAQNLYIFLMPIYYRTSRCPLF